MWIAGPDLIASVLLSGHFPNVQEAFRIVPHGKQRGLGPVKLRGAISVDPRKEDFFTRVVEYREQNKADNRLQYFLKILANSTSYGTYLELNPVKIDQSKRPKITVYSGEHIKRAARTGYHRAARQLLLSARRSDYIGRTPATGNDRKLCSGCWRDVFMLRHGCANYRREQRRRISADA